jgi:hypothetical protein
MKRLSVKGSIVCLIVVFAVISLSFPAQAEKKKIMMTSQAGQSTDQIAISPDNVPNHVLYQHKRKDTTTSSDPDFNNTEWMLYEQGDDVAGSESHRGYFTHFFKSGDVIYGKYEGTHKGTVKEGETWEGTSEGKSQYTGGTGKYKNIKGGGTYNCKYTAEARGYTIEVEIEY